ncbi:MAG: helix-turn-helix domain-containing protein [Deltaproteobacteria bacterium]|nr:helix-turn-helix domain-containing protein [Deltaproteobacteria bacterium]
MTPKAIRELREHLQLTQEVFARILGVSFATVNRWENGKTMPTGDYARVLQTLGQLTAHDATGPAIDWRRVGALSAMAAVAGFSPLLTLGAVLAPVLIAHLPSWSDVPLGGTSTGSLRPRPQGKPPSGNAPGLQKLASSVVRKTRAKAKAPPARALESMHADTQQKGL